MAKGQGRSSGQGVKLLYIRDYLRANTDKDHAKNACALVNEAWFDCYGVNASEFFLSAIKCHMGQWSEREDRPFTNIDRCVHMADYMASRNFIDIPQIVEEWESVRFEETSPEDSALAKAMIKAILEN